MNLTNSKIKTFPSYYEINLQNVINGYAEIEGGDTLINLKKELVSEVGARKPVLSNSRLLGGKSGYNSEEIILSIFISYETNKIFLEEHLYFIKNFIKKFEVFKRILKFYKDDFTKNSEEEIDQHILILFGCLLFEVKNVGVKYISTALKICDLNFERVSNDYIGKRVLNLLANQALTKLTKYD